MAVVYADGAIVDGEGFGREVYGNTLAATLAGVRADDKVKAVVLRVNSPGGSALASDVIWREMELLKAEKPVIVSMGSYAASGGYYISCPADVIVADKLTLTGSIGVFGMYLNTIDALKNKLGITFDAVKSNTSAGMGMTSALTPAERASIMRGVDKVYTTFTNNVAQGRNLPLEKVLDIAGGRVWSGDNALGIGLIDTYGGRRRPLPSLRTRRVGRQFPGDGGDRAADGFRGVHLVAQRQHPRGHDPLGTGSHDEGIQTGAGSCFAAGDRHVLSLQTRTALIPAGCRNDKKRPLEKGPLFIVAGFQGQCVREAVIRA